jgi:hypothetical protein
MRNRFNNGYNFTVSLTTDKGRTTKECKPSCAKASAETTIEAARASAESLSKYGRSEWYVSHRCEYSGKFTTVAKSEGWGN